MAWIVDDQQWPRACLRAELIERGYNAVGFVRLAHALAALRHSHVARPRIIVLGLRGMAFERGDLDTLARSGIPVVPLGGAAELKDTAVSGVEWARVMQRPFTIGAVADAVEQLLGLPDWASTRSLNPSRVQLSSIRSAVLRAK